MLQIFFYLAIAVGALAYGMAPGHGDVLRTTMALLTVGGLLVAMGHVVDGPVRVEMIEHGLGDGDQLYDLTLLSATWLIVPGYALLGLGGVLHAGRAVTSAAGTARAVAVVAVLLFAVGALAGVSELVEGLPGITFLGLALGWLWQAWDLGRRLRGTDRPASPVGGA